MFVDLLLFSLAFAFARWGRLPDATELRWPLLALLAGVADRAAAHLPGLGPLTVVTSYVALILFCAANHRMPGIRLLAAGTLLNGTAIALNGWRMPVDLAAAARAGYETTALFAARFHTHVALTPESGVPLLADRLFVPLPIPRVISVGDILIAVGFFLLVQGLAAKEERAHLKLAVRPRSARRSVERQAPREETNRDTRGPSPDQTAHERGVAYGPLDG